MPDLLRAAVHQSVFKVSQSYVSTLMCTAPSQFADVRCGRTKAKSINSVDCLSVHLIWNILSTQQVVES